MPSGSLCSGTAGAHACYPQVQLDESRMLIPLDTGVTAGADLQSGFSLEAAAGALATSERTLQRRFTAVLGKSPMAYFQDLRIERAQALLHGAAFTRRPLRRRWCMTMERSCGPCCTNGWGGVCKSCGGICGSSQPSTFVLILYRPQIDPQRVSARRQPVLQGRVRLCHPAFDIDRAVRAQVGVTDERYRQRLFQRTHQGGKALR